MKQGYKHLILGFARFQVKRIRVLLATLPPLVSGLFTHLIQGQVDMEVVDAVSEPVQLLVAVKETFSPRAHGSGQLGASAPRVRRCHKSL